MYGLRSDPGIDTLKGQTLIQVCFGENDLFLKFSGDISIGTYSGIGLAMIDQPVTRYEAFTSIAQELLALLGVEVVTVAWNSDGTIRITFSSGTAVEFSDDSQQFEAYTIKTPSGLVVV